MTTRLEEIYPIASDLPDSEALRQKTAEGFAAVFNTAALTGENFTIQPYAVIGVRGNDGDLVWYAYDSADTTTADDGGLTTIVVSGRRYKRSTETILTARVLSATTVAQPGSPALGDAYVLTAAPTGTDWASKAKNIATYTARGWVFRAPVEGLIVYVEDDAAFYHYSAGGTWTLGLGALGVADGSIEPQMLADPFYMIKVEDERNAPPGSAPTAGTCYQVGTSPTGGFSGHATEVARWDGSAWVFLAGSDGDTIYRKDIELLYTLRSGAWEPSVRAAGVQQVDHVTQASNSQTSVTSTPKYFTGSISMTSDTAKYLRVHLQGFQYDIYGGNGTTNDYEIGFYRDTESTPLHVLKTETFTGSGTTISLGAAEDLAAFHVAVPDTASHTYRIGVRRTSGTSSSGNAATAYTFMFIDEVAP